MTRLRVALTFDAEPGEELPGHNTGARGWARTLEVLEQAQVPGTFFLQADWAARHPGLARRTFAAGHLLGNHTLEHRNLGLSTQVEDDVQDQVVAAGRVLAAVTGADTKPWFRLPYFGGNRSARVQDALRVAGWEHVDRNCEARDWELSTSTATQVVENVLADAAEVDGPLVVLLHTWPAPTARGTALLVARLREDGASFVKIDQLSERERAEVALRRDGLAIVP